MLRHREAAISEWAVASTSAGSDADGVPLTMPFELRPGWWLRRYGGWLQSLTTELQRDTVDGFSDVVGSSASSDVVDGGDANVDGAYASAAGSGVSDSDIEHEESDSEEPKLGTAWSESESTWTTEDQQAVLAEMRKLGLPEYVAPTTSQIGDGGECCTQCLPL